MYEVTRDIDISAERAEVWRVLSDIGRVADYNPGLQSSSYVGAARGLDAKRRCVVDDTLSLDEQVVAWEPDRSYTLELTHATRFMPVKTLQVSFDVDGLGEGSTRVEQTMAFVMKGGLLGHLMAPLMRAQAKQAVRRNLEGLKHFVEAAR